MGIEKLSLIPEPEQLRELLAAPGGSDVALIEVDGFSPFYVGLSGSGALVEVHPS